MLARVRRMLSWTALPYIRHELPGWGPISRAVGVLDDSAWTTAPMRQVRGKLHGYEMFLDLRSWSDRQSFFLKRFYDLPSQLLLQQALRAGDRFIDVGANIGMMTLAAARCVGESGQIESFEPNPKAFERLSQHVQTNHLSNVKLHQAAVSEQAGTMELRVVGGHTGAGTLGEIRESDKSAVTMAVAVKVLRGDDVIPPGDRPTTIKIDVEGFELQVLRGFDRLLRENRPLVLAETVSWYLRRAGTSLDELYDFMSERGYRPHAFPLIRRGLGYQVKILPIDNSAAEQHKNVVWIHPDSPQAGRLASE